MGRHGCGYIPVAPGGGYTKGCGSDTILGAKEGAVMAMSWKRRWNSVRVAAAVCAVLVMMPAGLLRADDPAGGAAVGSKTKRLFWKVVSPTTEVYFLGSVHLATEDFYPLPAEIEAAYKKADVLLVEADVTKSDPATMAVMVMQQGMYPQGDSLDKHISPETMKALTAFCKDNQVPPALITVMKPAMVALTVEAAQAEKTGMKPELGIDMHFLNQANTDKKRIQELESADGQIKLIMGLDD